MIKISEATINSAFDKATELYPDWFDDKHRIYNIYTTSERAFSKDGKEEYFEPVYDELRKYWQVFRRGNTHWDSSQIYTALSDLPQSMRTSSLSELNNDQWLNVYNVINNVKDIKRNKSGYSVVAISKFLHFWNPRLFVIFDGKFMENYVFGHKYLSDELSSQQFNIAKHDPQLLKYLKVLKFAQALLVNNPEIMQSFRVKYQNTVIQDYEALAIEWLLLGLVDLPPEGVKLNRTL